MRIFKYIKKIDLFGPQVKIRFQNQKEYKTALGGCFTIILFIGIILLVFRYIEEMITRSNPILMFREELWQKGQIQNIGMDLFYQGIGIYDTNNKIYAQNIDIFANIFDQDGINYQYKLVSCQNIFIDLEDIQNSKYLQQFSKNDNQYYYCFSESDILKAQQIYIDYESKFTLEVKFNKQKDLDYFIDATNYNQPYQPYWKISYVNLAKDLFQQNIRVSLAVKQIITDKGYLTSLDKIQNKLTIQNLDIFKPSDRQTNQQGNNGQNDQLITVTISYQIDRKIQIQSRNYIKIIDTVAIVGGFIKSSMVILRFLSKPFTKMALQVSLLNELFNFDESQENDDGDGDGSRKGIQTLNKLNNKEEQELETQENIILNRILNQEIQNQSIKQFTETIENKSDKIEAENTFKKFMKIGQNTLIMGTIDYVKFYLSCFFKLKKKNQIKQSKKKVNERLDIVYILKKLVEIDKLKMILLNDQQRRLFDYLPKPVVKVQSVKTRMRAVSLLKPSNVHINARTEWSLIHSEFTPYQKAILAVKAFQYIMKSETTPLSLIDLKLIEMLDPDIIKRFGALQLNTITDFGQHLDQQDSNKKIERIQIPILINNDIKSIQCIQETDNFNNYKQQPIQESDLSLQIENQKEKIEGNNNMQQSPNVNIDHSEKTNTGRDSGRETIRDSNQNILKNSIPQQNKIENNFELKNNIQNQQKEKVFTMNLFDMGKSRMAESIVKTPIGKLRSREFSNPGQNELASPTQNSNKLQIVQQYFNQRKQINSFVINSDSMFIDQLLSSQYQFNPKPQGQQKLDFSKSVNQPNDITKSQNPMQARIQKQIKADDRLNTIDESVYHESVNQCTPQINKKMYEKSDVQLIQSLDHLYDQTSTLNDINLISPKIDPLDQSVQPQIIAQERTDIQNLNPSITQIKQNKFTSQLNKSELQNDKNNQ